MSRRKFIKGVLIASSVLIIGWFALFVLLQVFRTPLLGTRFKSAGKLYLNTFTAASAAMFLGSLCMLTANFLIYGNSENRKLPLMISGFSAALVPIIVRIAYSVQHNVLDTHDSGDRAVDYAYYIYSGYHRHMLSVYQQTSMPMSYIFYAGAAAAVIAAAVYAFDGENAVRRAAGISWGILIAGTVFQIMLYLFQGKIIQSVSGIEQGTKIVFYPAVTVCIAALGVMAADYLLISRKGILAPLMISASTAAVLPFLTIFVSAYQTETSDSTYISADEQTVLVMYSSISISLFYFIYAGAVITAAASAVNLFNGDDDSYEFTDY